MTRNEILNTPEIVDFMIDKSVMVDSKMKLHKRLDELCKLAIEALEQEPCEDAVSRQAVKEQMIYYGFHAPDMTVTEFVEDCLPSVNPQKKTGHWIKYGKLYQCSECKELSCCQGKFCNECGVKMIELQESEVEDGNDSR